MSSGSASNCLSPLRSRVCLGFCWFFGLFFNYFCLQPGGSHVKNSRPLLSLLCFLRICSSPSPLLPWEPGTGMSDTSGAEEGGRERKSRFPCSRLAALGVPFIVPDRTDVPSLQTPRHSRCPVHRNLSGIPCPWIPHPAGPTGAGIYVWEVWGRQGRRAAGISIRSCFRDTKLHIPFPRLPGTRRAAHY